MFHKILVAIDSSKNNHQVFDQALALAKATGSNLMLLHVLSSEEEGSPNVSMVGLEYYPTIAGEVAEMYQKQWADYENRGLEMLQFYAERAAAAGVSAESTQNFGSPGRIICELARTWEADLIVMGRRGHSGLNELILGSVSNYVLHHASCSVFTIQSHTQANSDVSQAKQAAIVS
jgi:nucleotide-binding universal stress UspA family protein